MLYESGIGEHGRRNRGHKYIVVARAHLNVVGGHGVKQRRRGRQRAGSSRGRCKERTITTHNAAATTARRVARIEEPAQTPRPDTGASCCTRGRPTCPPPLAVGYSPSKLEPLASPGVEREGGLARNPGPTTTFSEKKEPRASQHEKFTGNEPRAIGPS